MSKAIKEGKSATAEVTQQTKIEADKESSNAKALQAEADAEQAKAKEVSQKAKAAQEKADQAHKTAEAAIAAQKALEAE